MKAVILYDSTYGNTERLALGMAEALQGSRTFRVNEVTAAELRGHDLLIAGSPTQGGRPTSALMKFLEMIPQGGLVGTQVAAFDTRFAAQERGIGLRILMKLIGYAAPRIASALEAKGGQRAAAPEGFIVEDKEGPLRAGELERATRWAADLMRESGEQV